MRVDQKRLMLPRAIWMPLGQRIPSCYQGSPKEIVQQMGFEMKPGLGVDDTIDLIARVLADERGVRLRTPHLAPEDIRAEAFVRGLLDSGVAVEMPKA